MIAVRLAASILFHTSILRSLSIPGLGVCKSDFVLLHIFSEILEMPFWKPLFLLFWRAWKSDSSCCPFVHEGQSWYRISNIAKWISSLIVMRELYFTENSLQKILSSKMRWWYTQIVPHKLTSCNPSYSSESKNIPRRSGQQQGPDGPVGEGGLKIRVLYLLLCSNFFIATS